MPPYCSVCTSRHREAVDEGLVAGRALRDLGKEYGLSKDAIARHRDHHLSPVLKEHHEAREGERAETLVDRIERLWDRCERVLDEAEDDRRPFLTLAAARELRGVAELLARLLGLLKGEGVQINLQTVPMEQLWAFVKASSEWAQFVRQTAEALKPFPDALAAVINTFQDPSTPPRKLDHQQIRNARYYLDELERKLGPEPPNPWDPRTRAVPPGAVRVQPGSGDGGAD